MRLAIAQRLTMAHGIRGGLETQAQTLAEGLIERNHELVTLTTPHPDGRREGMEGKVPVRYLAPGTYRRYTRAWGEVCYRELEHMQRNKRIDLLLNQHEGIVGHIPQVVNTLGIPVVAVIHGTMRAEFLTRIRHLSSARGIYRFGRYLLTMPALFAQWRKAAPLVARWIVVSHETARDWQRELGLSPDRIVIIPNGVDTTSFRPNVAKRQATRARLGIPDDRPVLMAVGRVEQEKGFQVAIQALQILRKKFPTVQFIIAGDGHYRGTLERLAARANQDAGFRSSGASTYASRESHDDTVILAGYVPHAQLPDLLAAADIFLVPTLCDEAFPLTVVEAMAMGLPVIASKVGGIPTAIEDGKSGILVPMGNALAIAQAAERLLCDTTLRESLGRTACEVAQTRFSRAHMVEATERVLLEVVGQHQKVSVD